MALEEIGGDLSSCVCERERVDFPVCGLSGGTRHCPKWPSLDPFSLSVSEVLEGDLFSLRRQEQQEGTLVLGSEFTSYVTSSVCPVLCHGKGWGSQKV